jgi:hypothetical protein
MLATMGTSNATFTEEMQCAEVEGCESSVFMEKKIYTGGF